MNLINDGWIPVRRKDGEISNIAPWQIAETDNPVIDIAAPRPDFQGALYQFLIGLMQTAFAAEDQEQWLECWQETPEADSIKQAFSTVASAFELINPNGPAFLQDFSLPEGEKKPVAALLIEAPGGKTLEDNLDHFVKGGVVGGICHSCAAAALFTLQTNAPSGGVGHRVGLRGGGPLTTLFIPEDRDSTLWKRIWLNVLTQEEYALDYQNLSAVLPWLANTRLSDKKGVSTLPGDAHPLQMYWGMPRRIRLQASGNADETCTLCGAESTTLIHHFITKNYGVNYEGPWLHPLTPYRVDPEHKKPPLSLKGQPGGLGYRHWLGLSLQDKDDQAAQITLVNQNRVREFGEELRGESLRMWCFGFDMDNMKARCWYEHQMPVMDIPEDCCDVFIDLVASLLAAAKDTLSLLRGQVKAAWFERPKDAKGNTRMIDASFWEATESLFYTLLHDLAQQLDSTLSHMPPSIASEWVKKLRREARRLFDHWVLEGNAEDWDMKRIFNARLALAKKLYTVKSLKDLDQVASLLEQANEKEEVV